MVRTQEGKDHLTVLPDEILLKIMADTKSYKSVVMCSILSKRWKNLCKDVSDFYFDPSDIWKDNTNRSRAVFQQIVSTALFRCRHDISTLALTIDGVDESMPVESSWLRFAALHNVKDLCINGNHEYYPLLDPRLSNRVPISFSHLVSCTLWEITIPDEEFMPTLLLWSSVLKSLKLGLCDSQGILKIQSSSLSTLHIYYCDFPNEDYVTISCPCLSSLRVNSPAFEEWSIRDDIHLQKLSVHYDCLDFVKLIPTMDLLQVTDIQDRPSLALWKRIASFSNFESLQLEFICDELDSSLFCTKAENLDQLKNVEKVTIEFRRVYEEERWFVRQILLNSPNLVVLELLLKQSVSDGGIQELRKDISLLENSAYMPQVKFLRVRNKFLQVNMTAHDNSDSFLD